MAIEVFFATNRNKKSDKPEFSTEINQRDPILNFGKAEIEMDNNCTASNVSKIHVSEAVSHKEEEGKVCCDEDIFKETEDRMHRGIDTVIFFHGFNYTFEESLEGAAELKCLYEKQGNCEYTMIVFSWPSDGSVWFSYDNDRHDIDKSGKIFAQGLKQMGQFLEKLCLIKLARSNAIQDVNRSGQSDREGGPVNCGRVHIMAHSMGVYALRHVLENLCEIIRQENEENGIQDSRIPKLIDEILLIAADEDSDAFATPHEKENASCETKLYSLPELAERISIYFYEGDDALAFSDWFVHNTDRMGSIGLSNIRQIPSNVFLINCEKVIEDSFWSLEHRYHKTNSAVIKDISYVLKGFKSEEMLQLTRIQSYETNKTENSYHLKQAEVVAPFDSKQVAESDLKSDVPVDPEQTV